MSGDEPEVQEVEVVLTFVAPTNWSKDDIKIFVVERMVKACPEFVMVKSIREEAEIYSAEG
jgi:hypothetical protein